MALLTMKDISISFGGPLVLDNVNLQIEQGERLCLLGRNGAGKSTLMRLMTESIVPDSGEITRRPGIVVAYMTQEVPLGLGGKVFDVVLSGLGEQDELLRKYQHLTSTLSDESSRAVVGELDRVSKALDAKTGWQLGRLVEKTLSRMELDPQLDFQSLSAGMKRRVLLARGLVSAPDILLLDEPTNHLDIEAINWLEQFLLDFNKTLLFVTHDRVFLQMLATRILELDRGKLTSWQCDYETYLKRKEAMLDAEIREWELFDKKLSEEEVWVRKGIKARRTRNEGRVRALKKMREERHARREIAGTVRMQAQEAEISGKLVLEAENVNFSYDTKRPVIRDFSAVIMRGDKIGIVGPNGSGKTTLLNLILGELKPQKGRLRHGTHLEIGYFDQLREQLDEEKTVADNVGRGSNMITIEGKNRHVIGYLRDFLFSADRARTPVAVLSGGERNRLLLARLFTKPSNVLVLDEPTNDLDAETLDLLEELLLDYTGTVLLVSHDRAFLNNVVTSTMVFEGDGTVTEYVGGYDDWLRQRKAGDAPLFKKEKAPVKEEKEELKPRPKPERPKKMSFKEKQELIDLPHRIEALEEEQQRLYDAMSDPNFYAYERDRDVKVAQTQARLESIKQELADAYQRWEDLDKLNAMINAAEAAKEAAK